VFLIDHFAGHIQRSLDGGRTWQTLRGPGQPAAFQFVSHQRGWELGGYEGRELRRSDDGGRTWTPVTVVGSDVNVLAFSWLDAQHGWLVGNNCANLTSVSGPCTGAVLRTSDGGRHWQLIHLPRVFGLGEESYSYVSSGFRMVTPRVGYVEDGGGLYRTDDGGRTWRFVSGWHDRGKFFGPSD
jgi:photosystem II stability/assembly factor-like uncharacterized protein